MIALVELLSGLFGLVGVLVGLAVPAVTKLLEHVILSPVRRRERNEETADQRADEAAVECLATLAMLEELIPRRASLYDSRLLDEADTEERRNEHDKAVAKLEGSIFVLNEAPRKALTQVLGVLRYGYDLPLRTKYGHEEGWHPDSAHQIAESTVRHCRHVLSSARRREELPKVPDQIREYIIAVDDRNDEFTDEFAQEVHETGEAIRNWRTGHDLSPDRKPW